MRDRERKKETKKKNYNHEQTRETDNKQNVYEQKAIQ